MTELCNWCEIDLAVCDWCGGCERCCDCPGGPEGGDDDED